MQKNYLKFKKLYNMKKIDKNIFIKIIQKIINNKIKLNMETKIKDIQNLDSLNYTKIVLALQKKTNKKISFSIFDNSKTLKDLYKKI